MRLQTEFSGLAPQAWVMLAEALLHVTQRPAQPLSPPVTIEQASDVLAAFFSRHIWLELGVGGVWRGPKFITFDQQPWRFVQVLWTKSNTPISADDPDLGRVVHTKANAHKLANRVRERLEPVSAPRFTSSTIAVKAATGSKTSSPL